MSGAYFRELMTFIPTQRPESVLKFESQETKGSEGIISKLLVGPSWCCWCYLAPICSRLCDTDARF